MMQIQDFVALFLWLLLFIVILLVVVVVQLRGVKEKINNLENAIKPIDDKDHL